MNRIRTIFLTACVLAGSATAGEPTKELSPSHLYFFAGVTTIPGKPIYTYWQDSYVQIGGGGEHRVRNGLALGGEIIILTPLSTNKYARNGAIVSLDPSYHFARHAGKKTDPFISGGLSVLGAANGASGMVNFGGGINYWVRPKFGLKLEIRDHMWPSEGTAVHFVGVRLGACVR